MAFSMVKPFFKGKAIMCKLSRKFVDSSIPRHPLLRDDPVVPVHDAGADGVLELEDDEAAAEVGVEIVDVVGDAEGVDPVAEHPLLPRLLPDLHHALLRWRIQSGMVVE